MAKVDANVFPKIIGGEGAAPATPAAATAILYVKADGLWYSKDDAGVETLVSGGAGGTLTDHTHAATGSGATGGGATLAPTTFTVPGGGKFSAGASMPGTPASGDRVWRTDLGLEFYYDGTRWVSAELFFYDIAIISSLFPLSATATSQRLGTLLGIGTDIWLVSCMTTFWVNTGGTALGASHSWVAAIFKADTALSGTTLITVNVNSGASGALRQDTQAIGALLGTAATYPSFNITWTKTGTPGTLILGQARISYRIVQT